MGKSAFLFPGQGSQAVGMGQDLYNHSDEVKKLYDTAKKVLPFDIEKMMFEGPLEELTKTYHAQPALLLSSISAYEQLKSYHITPDYVAGHSLGEYTALVASGVVSLQEGLHMVYRRGVLMSEAVPAGEGSMLAVLGMDLEAVIESVSMCQEKGHKVYVANINTPSQIVLSGTKEGIEFASKLVTKKGAKRAIPLNVSGPFHSEFMNEAAEKLETEFKNSKLHESEFPIVSNCCAKSSTDGELLFKRAIEGMYSPVRWVETIQYLQANGVDTFIEVGPNKVLSGLVKSINRRAKVYSVSDVVTLNHVISELKGEKI